MDYLDIYLKISSNLKFKIKYILKDILFKYDEIILTEKIDNFIDYNKKLGCEFRGSCPCEDLKEQIIKEGMCKGKLIFKQGGK